MMVVGINLLSVKDQNLILVKKKYFNHSSYDKNCFRKKIMVYFCYKFDSSNNSDLIRRDKIIFNV